MSKKGRADEELSRLRERLRASLPPDDLPYDLRWARRVLEGEEAAPPEVVRDDVVAALTEELVERLQSDVLTRLAASGHKTVSKAARTGLYRLRSQKVAVEVPSPMEPPRTGSGLLQEAELTALLTMYDSRGQRLIFLGMPASKGILLHQARISSAHGLLDFETYSSTRGRYHQLVQRVREQMLAGEVSRAQAHWFVEEAARLSRQKARGIPEGYAAASQLLGAPPPGEHPALAIAPAQAGPEELVALLEERALSLWVPERAFLRKLDLQLQEVATSRIVVDERQRSAQMAAVIERSVAEYHTPDRIAAARRLLLDTAHLLSLVGGPADRVRQAADLYLQPAEQLCTHPLPRAFLQRLIRRAQDREPPPERRSEGGLLLPGR
jgi:hypothetical protein